MIRINHFAVIDELQVIIFSPIITHQIIVAGIATNHSDIQYVKTMWNRISLLCF